MRVEPAYGDKGLELTLPDENTTIIEPEFVPGLEDEKSAFIEEASNQISRTLQAVRNLEEYEKEKKRLHEEYSSRISDVEAKIEGERKIASAMLKHIEDSIKASPERETQTPSSTSTIEANPKVEDLRSRIKTEIENIQKVAFSTCVHCGSLLVEGANFCPYCGRKQK